MDQNVKKDKFQSLCAKQCMSVTLVDTLQLSRSAHASTCHGVVVYALFSDSHVYFRPLFEYNSYLFFIFSSTPIITNILSTETSLHQLNIITTFLKTILREALNCTECIPSK